MESTTAEVGVGVDWITVTAAHDPQARLLRELGVELLMDHAKGGNKVRPFKMGPYYGGCTARVGVGDHEGRALVALNGQLSNEWWRELLVLSTGCTRLDLQVSVRQVPYDPWMAVATWTASTQARAQEGRPPQYDLYARRGQGSTLYIGDGSSRYLARMYERFPKTKEPADFEVWRYEVEAKRERAEQAAALLACSDDADGFTRRYVHQHFDRRGVTPIFSVDTPLEVPPLPPETPDADRSIAWLAASVRPVLRRLGGWDRTKDALAALGLAANDLDWQDVEPDAMPHP